MTLNGVIALILRLSPNSIASQADYVTVVEDRPIMSDCLQVPVFHFWPKLTHPAARYLCDSWTTCNHYRCKEPTNRSGPLLSIPWIFFYNRLPAADTRWFVWL